MEKYTIDRIEAGIAICEDEKGSLCELSSDILPRGIKEGDILEKSEKGFAVLAEETADRREKMYSLQNSIFGRKTDR